MITGAALWPIMTAISSQMATRTHRYTLALPTNRGAGGMVPWTQKTQQQDSLGAGVLGTTGHLVKPWSPAVYGHLLNCLPLFFLAAG